MGLDTITLIETSQEHKDRYYMISLVCYEDPNNIDRSQESVTQVPGEPTPSTRWHRYLHASGAQADMKAKYSYT